MRDGAVFADNHCLRGDTGEKAAGDGPSPLLPARSKPVKVLMNLRYTIYERKVQTMASWCSNVLVRATFLRVTDPRSGGGKPGQTKSRLIKVGKILPDGHWGQKSRTRTRTRRIGKEVGGQLAGGPPALRNGGVQATAKKSQGTVSAGNPGVVT